MEDTDIHKASPSRLLVFIPSWMKAIKGGSLYTVELGQNLGSVLQFCLTCTPRTGRKPSWGLG